ncbi:MAG: hypothetical protein RDU89_01160 [bacterium]|nr:hypothetical protein [bacterium]
MSCTDGCLRASAGTAALLGLTPSPGDVPATTAYFLLGSRCHRDCGFCPQARSSRARGDLLSRVTWPEVNREEALAALPKSGARRVCLQLTDSPEAVAAATSVVGRGLPLPVCVAATGLGLEGAAGLLRGGADRVALPLDAATSTLYHSVKGEAGWERTRGWLRELARAFPGRVSTHLVAGLGESEQEMLQTIAGLLDDGVTVGLFAFTPVAGTRLADRPRPPLTAYRRLQVGHFLLREGAADFSRFRFRSGRLVATGLSRGSLAGILATGEAFQTSGCPDCNRPYYNERPGRDLYNYPRPLTPREAGREVRAVLAELAPGPGPSPGQRWRLVETGPGPAAWNMAVDEALALVHARGSTPPTLRLYTWAPPAVSIGRGQPVEGEVDCEACRREGVDLVRRPTGGRAVFHDRELTYCVVISQALLPGDILTAYRRLAEGLVEVLRELGLEPELAPARVPARPATLSSACFEVPSAHEILVSGRKVVGSAQMRRQGIILQHGSLLLEFSPERLARLLPGVSAERLRRRAAGVGELLGQAVGPARAARAFEAGFARGLGIILSRGSLTSEELEVARSLSPRYDAPDLTPAQERR